MQYLILSFFVTMFIVVFIFKTRFVNFALDQPNERSLHTQLIPRIGGLAIILGILASWLLLPIAWYWIVCSLVIMLVSLFDDIQPLSIKYRLLTQALASILLLSCLLPNEPGWLVALLSILITWMANLYNFMDGSDGLAGGMGLIGFSAYSVAAWLVGDINLALMSGVIAATCLAFLLFNFYPAKIFMGDSGSITLGFLAGAIGLHGYYIARWPIWFPVLVFSPFIIDASFTLIKRQISGEKFWQAHRNHYYQRLVQMGWGHKKTAIAEYILMLCVASTAIFLLDHSTFSIIIILILWFFIYLTIMYLINQYWMKFNCHQQLSQNRQLK